MPVTEGERALRRGQSISQRREPDPRGGTGAPDPGSHRGSESGALARSYQTVKEPRSHPPCPLRPQLLLLWTRKALAPAPCRVPPRLSSKVAWGLWTRRVPLRMSSRLGGSPAASDTSAFPATISRQSVSWRRGGGGGGISPGQIWTHSGHQSPEFQARMDSLLPTVPSTWRCCGCCHLERSNKPSFVLTCPASSAPVSKRLPCLPDVSSRRCPTRHLRCRLSLHIQTVAGSC